MGCSQPGITTPTWRTAGRGQSQRVTSRARRSGTVTVGRAAAGVSVSRERGEVLALGGQDEGDSD